jgi:hypothetical protein
LRKQALLAHLLGGSNVAVPAAFARNRIKEATTMRFPSATLFLFVLMACGGSSLPPAKVVDAQSSISAAAAVGAEQNPQAALHLKMARDQVRQAQLLLADGKEEQARLVLERADADAEVALMITREAQASANAKKAQTEVENLQNRNQ